MDIKIDGTGLKPDCSGVYVDSGKWLAEASWTGKPKYVRQDGKWEAVYIEPMGRWVVRETFDGGAAWIGGKPEADIAVAKLVPLYPYKSGAPTGTPVASESRV